MAYNKPAKSTQTVTAAQAVNGVTAAAPSSARRPTAAAATPTIAWLNLELVDRNGNRHKVQQGVPIQGKRAIDRALLKTIGVDVDNITFDVSGEPVFTGNIDESHEFTLVGVVNLVKPVADIEL